MTADSPVIDQRYLVDTMLDLVEVPTDVSMGFDTFIEPDHPKLVHYVQDVVRPRVHELGLYDVIDAADNNLVVRYGPHNDRPGILIQNYTPAQHFNLMSDPFRARVAIPPEGKQLPSVYGMGVTQCKAHQASMLTALKYLAEHDVQLARPLYWAINNEGLSSHRCSWAILDAIANPLDLCVIQIGSDLCIHHGNRGRVDINVHLTGTVTHSSTPHLGRSAIDGLHAVMDRLRTLSWDEHPLLGARQAIVYKVQFSPLAPHTIPSDAEIAIDRRLLPGDTAAAATAEIRALLDGLDGFQVAVSAGYSMLPNLAAVDDPMVQALAEAHRHVTGTPASLEVFGGSFDAGGPGSRNVPTVHYGASGGIWPTGDDFVAIEDVVIETRTLVQLVLTNLTG